MKILVISQTYCEWNSRAKWRSLVKDYSDVEIKVITPQYWPDVLSKVISKKEQINKFCVLPSKTFFLGHEIYHFYPGLSKIIRNFRPDFIQVETGSNSLALLQVILINKFLRLGAKIIFFSWVNWIPKFGWKYNFFYIWIERFNLRNSNGAILGNKDAENILLKTKKFQNKTTVIPQLGTDSNVFCAAKDKAIFKKRFGLDENKFVIGFAGRLVDEKGVLFLIETFELLKKQIEQKVFETLCLVIAGDGPDITLIKEKIGNSDVGNQILLLGSLDHAQMPDFFKAIDIFVLPSFDTLSWKEQFGQVLVQAMMSSISLIGSDAGEIPNVICDSGLIFKQKDKLDLVRCLKILLSKQQRSVFEQKGLQRAKKYYSNDAIARQTYEFYNQLLQEN